MSPNTTIVVEGSQAEEIPPGISEPSSADAIVMVEKEVSLAVDVAQNASITASEAIDEVNSQKDETNWLRSRVMELGSEVSALTQMTRELVEILTRQEEPASPSPTPEMAEAIQEVTPQAELKSVEEDHPEAEAPAPVKPRKRRLI